jgi:hypothetical protein
VIAHEGVMTLGIVETAKLGMMTSVGLIKASDFKITKKETDSVNVVTFF